MNRKAGVVVRNGKKNASENLKVAEETRVEGGGSGAISKGRASRSRSGEREGGSAKFVNSDLPFEVGLKKAWRNVFCDTLFEYIGTAEDPFKLDLQDVQDVWDVVYPQHSYAVEINGPVYYIVCCLLVFGIYTDFLS